MHPYTSQLYLLPLRPKQFFLPLYITDTRARSAINPPIIHNKFRARARTLDGRLRCAPHAQALRSLRSLSRSHIYRREYIARRARRAARELVWKALSAAQQERAPLSPRDAKEANIMPSRALFLARARTFITFDSVIVEAGFLRAGDFFSPGKCWFWGVDEMRRGLLFVRFAAFECFCLGGDYTDK